MYVTCVQGVSGDQKRASACLELELQAVVLYLSQVLGAKLKPCGRAGSSPKILPMRGIGLSFKCDVLLLRFLLRGTG